MSMSNQEVAKTRAVNFEDDSIKLALKAEAPTLLRCALKMKSKEKWCMDEKPGVAKSMGVILRGIHFTPDKDMESVLETVVVFLSYVSSLKFVYMLKCIDDMGEKNPRVDIPGLLVKKAVQMSLLDDEREATAGKLFVDRLRFITAYNRAGALFSRANLSGVTKLLSAPGDNS